MDPTPPERSNKAKRVGVCLLALGVLLILTHELVLSVYQVSGVSMLPALRDGQRVVVLKRFYAVARGDQLVFKNPNAPDEVLVKRVLFLPGERFEVAGGQIRLDGGSGGSIGSHLQPGVGALGRIPASVVPSESFFLVGDNLAESIDSRTLGAIPRRLVVGKVVRTLGQ